MKVFSVIAGMVLLSITSYGQQVDFSGTWIFNDQQSISGDPYSDVSPTRMKVIQKKDALSVEKMTAAGNGDVTTSETVSFDGQPFQTITPSGRKKMNRIKWSGDQKTLTETEELFSVSDSSKAEYRVTDNWSLENGKLVLVRKDENLIIGEVQESKLFYGKQ